MEEERDYCNSIPFFTSMANFFIVNNIKIIYTDYLLFSKTKDKNYNKR